MSTLMSPIDRLQPSHTSFWPILLVLACPISTVEAQSTSRAWLPDKWTMMSSFPSRDDTLLLNPELLVALDSTIILADAADRRIKAFSSSGHLLWTFGRSGQGPREFGNITDIKLAPDRSLWINDPANSRITVITPTGQFLRSLRTLAPLHRIIPLRDSSYLAFSAGAVFLVRYSPTGTRIGALPEPQFLAGVNPRAAESLFLPLPDGGAIAGFRWTTHLVRLRSDGAISWQTAGRTGLPFPSFDFQKVKLGKTQLEVGRVSPDAQQSTMGLAATPWTLLALASERAPSGNAIADIYDLASGSYLGSSELPVPAVAFTYDAGKLTMLVYDPYPRIVIARLAN